MRCELGATAFVGATVSGGGATGDTVWVIGVVAFADGVWSGTVGALLCIYTVLAYVTVFLTLIALNGFLSVFDDNYPKI